MRAAIDTNVWVSGLIRPAGPPGRILETVRQRRITPLATWELAAEIAEVLRRPELGLYRITEADVIDVLALLAPFLPNVEVTVDLRDVEDLPVIAAALSGRADAIITGDRDMLDDDHVRQWLAERGIALLQPAEALRQLPQRDEPS